MTYDREGIAAAQLVAERANLLRSIAAMIASGQLHFVALERG